jgi:hypothetical protein
MRLSKRQNSTVSFRRKIKLPLAMGLVLLQYSAGHLLSDLWPRTCCLLWTFHVSRILLLFAVVFSGLKADNLIAFCEPTVYKMWNPQRLIILWASTPVTGIALLFKYKYCILNTRYNCEYSHAELLRVWWQQLPNYWGNIYYSFTRHL